MATTPDAALAEQWHAITHWLAGLGRTEVESPSILTGWTVRDLAAHLVPAMGVLAGSQPVPTGTAVDHDLASYLRSYSDNADGILRGAIEAAQPQGDDGAGALRARLEARGTEALEHLAALRAEGITLVRVRRGVVTLDMLVMTRLIELVVHGDDLARSVDQPGPVQPAALDLVSAALARIAERDAPGLRVLDAAAWVRLAAGRSEPTAWTAAIECGSPQKSPALLTRLPLL